MMPSQRTAKEAGSLVREQNWSRTAEHQPRPRRLQSVKQPCQHPPAFPKISTIIFRKKRKAFAFEKRRISNAVRASDLLRCGGRPPHFGGADARQKFQREFAHGEDGRGSSVHLLPSLSAGGRRLVDATALSGDGFQDVNAVPLHRKERD